MSARGVGNVAGKGRRNGGGRKRFGPIVLRTNNGGEISLSPNETSLKTHAMGWAYDVLNRRSFLTDKSNNEVNRGRCRDTLEILGVTPRQLEQLRAASVIEVAIPYTREDQGWEARILPWEYLLTTATRESEKSESRVVIRQLCCNDDISTAEDDRQELLFVESCPGRLREIYQFDYEVKLVKSHWEKKGRDVALLKDPTPDELRAKISAQNPKVIHFSAVDSHQGIELLGWDGLYSKRDRKDGVVMAGHGVEPILLEARDVAEILTAGATPPRLVCCNFYNSAARTAAMTVAYGASAAVGFQDQVDDGLAESFFADFYLGLSEKGMSGLLAAFVSALQLVQGKGIRLVGTGVVLWSRSSLLKSMTRELRTSTDEIRQSIEDQYKSNTLLEVAPAGDRLRCSIEPCEELNYSLLHNDEDIFKTFQISLNEVGALYRVLVEVELHVGDEVPKFQVLIDLTGGMRELKSLVRLPLTSSLVRSNRSNIQTALRVRISHEKKDLFVKTYRIALRPIDEWVDDDKERRWLPSFVLSGDPIVPSLVKGAEKYLRALADDACAGFGGVQSIGANSDDPYLQLDNQVQAIWWALVQESQLAYISPPPSFRGRRQRLRTPSDLIGGAQGTCIDLCLLFAACLEYVEIHPVIFLLDGHAFAGYWREGSSIGTMQSLLAVIGDDTSSDDAHGGERPEVKGEEGARWMAPAASYPKIIELVRTGRLVPVETTLLTQQGSFWEAVEQGMENLRTQADFEAMYDVATSRRDVTPLPVHRR